MVGNRACSKCVNARTVSGRWFCRQIYKARWQIEIFFKWIKPNLKIKTFLGTSKNAVMTHIWVAMCYYLLLSLNDSRLARLKPQDPQLCLQL